MPNVNFKNFQQIGSLVTDIVKQATGRDAVQNLDMDYVTVAQNKEEQIHAVQGRSVTFETNFTSPLKKVIAKINPVQDLHGQEYPYPAGGGKNLYDADSFPSTEKVGITITNNGDGSFTLNGTAISDCFFNIFNNQINLENTLPRAQYRLTGCPEGGSQSTFYMYVTPGYASDSGEGVTFTNTVTGGSIYIKSGYTCDNLVFRPMLRLASDGDDTFAPYSNICPITGWTKCTITQTGSEDENTYEIEFGNDAGTVYGGTLNATTGELLVDYAIINTTWGDMKEAVTLGSTIRKLYAAPVEAKYPNGNQYSNIAPYIDAYNLDSTHFYVTATSAIMFLPVETENSTSIQIVYELAQPITYSLTPTEIDALIGENTMSADTGDIYVEYSVWEDLN